MKWKPIAVVVIALLTLGLAASWAYLQGLRTGIDLARSNAFEATIQKLGVFRGVASSKTPADAREILLMDIQTEIRRFLLAEDLKKSSSRPFLNLGFTIRGEPNTYDVLSMRTATVDDDIAQMMEVCRKATQDPRLYETYCEKPIKEYQQRWTTY